MDKKIINKISTLIDEYKSKENTLYKIEKSIYDYVIDFHDWVDGKDIKSIHLVRLPNGEAYWVLLIAWNDKYGWYLVVFPEEKTRPLLEAHNFKDNHIFWKYSPRKQDGKNSQRKRLFADKYGKDNVEFSVPNSLDEIDDFFGNIFDVSNDREKCDNLEKLEGKLTNDPIIQLIETYKKKIKQTQLIDEVYKWELAKKYKGKPDILAKDFSKEITNIKYENLVYAMGIAVIRELSKNYPEELRDCFTDLFNEKDELNKRIKEFNERTLKLYRRTETKKSHHQDERTIATHLTFFDSTKYTFYKDSFYQKYCKLIGEKTAKVGEKYVHYLQLINQLIDNYILKDNELINLVKELIPDYYNGTNNMILAQDILYSLESNTMEVEIKDRQYWLYAPGENANKWEEFYDQNIMGLGWDYLGDINNYSSKNEIVKKLQKLENTKSSKSNDATANYEFKNVLAVGDIVIAKKGRSEYLGYGIVTSPYYYDENRDTFKKLRKINWIKKGVWKEPKKDIVLKTLTNITKYPDYVEKLIELIGIEKNNSNMKPVLNQILFGPPGTGKTYHTINKSLEIIDPDFLSKNIDNRPALIKRFNELKDKGQIVFTTFHQSMSYEDFVEGIKPKTVDNEVQYEIEDGVFKQLCFEARKKVVNNFEEAYNSLINEISENENDYIDLQTKTGKEFRISLNSNNNLSLHTGSDKNKQGVLTKEKIHKQLLGENVFVGWESYFYGVEKYLREKHNFKTEKENKEKKYVIVIDEINRGNVSSIFGELITLIEDDKRTGGSEALDVLLPYSKEPFSVPSNLYIIGTMNTADRSVEAFDTALRRRFSFIEMPPKPELIKSVGKCNNGILDGIDLSELLITINKRILKLLDKDHMIGHSYFLSVKTIDDLKLVFHNKIIPLLQEYFFGDYGKIGLVIGSGFIEETVVDDDDFFADFDYEKDSILEKPVYQIIDVTKLSNDEFMDSINNLLG